MRDQHSEARAMPIEHTNATTLVGFIKGNAPEGATVVTDEFKAYRSLPKHGFTHKTVRHFACEYVRDMAHTSGIESFWSLLMDTLQRYLLMSAMPFLRRTKMVLLGNRRTRSYITRRY